MIKKMVIVINVVIALLTICFFSDIQVMAHEFEDEKVYCTQCNNDIRFYQIKGEYFDTNII